MLADVGCIFIGLASTIAVYALFTAFWCIRQSDPRWAESGRNGVYTSATVLALAWSTIGNRRQLLNVGVCLSGW